ncbi:hypothetical protein ACWGI9_14310 [Streptomyces sp. NPDC054833]
MDRISFAGLPVRVRVSGDPRPLPRGGDGGRAEVGVRYADHTLRVEVLSTGTSVRTGCAAVRPPVSGRHEGAGRGRSGLRERVAVYGGDLDARRRLGGYRVRARIPLDRP